MDEKQTAFNLFCSAAQAHSYDMYARLIQARLCWGLNIRWHNVYMHQCYFILF